MLLSLLLLLLPFLLPACGDGGSDEPGGPKSDGGLNEPDVIQEACDPGTRACADLEHIQTCKPSGFGWLVTRCLDAQGVQQSCVEKPCEDGQGDPFCVDVACVDRVCLTPGAFERCVDPKTQLRCNPTGTGWEELPCDGVCVDDQGCQETICRPGKRRCQNESLLEECNEEGTRWVAVQDCKTGSRICQDNVGPTGAQCVELCEVVRKERSYLGCEYWAVDLDNAFVPGDSASGFHDAQGKQFAVVVSNVSTEFEARVTVSTDVDAPMYCAAWADIPHIEDGAFVYDPDAVWCAEDLDRCLTQQRCTTITSVDGSGRRVWRDVCTEIGRLECEPEVSVPPEQLLVLNLARRDVNGTILAKLAFRVQSSIPINAYQFNPLENQQVFSNDASLLLPISVLGKNYLVMTREQTFDVLKGYLTVVAVWPGTTEVFVTPTVRTLPGPGIPALAPGQRKRFTLNQFDVLNIETNCPADDRGYCRTGDDLTGSEVFADKIIAVFGGSEASDAPNTNHCSPHAEGETGVCWDGTTPCRDDADCDRFITCCADHLEAQLFPIETWGRRYIATKSYDRNMEPDVWRIMAQRDGTVVQTIPHQLDIPVLNRGQFIDFESTEHFEIRASSAVLVGQFLTAEQAPDPNVRGVDEPGDAGTGDPAFMLAVPVEQYLDRYIILAPDKYAFDYASITAPHGTSVLIDGEPVPPGAFEPVGDGGYAVARLPISDGVHSIVSVPEDGESVGAPIGVIVYGYDQYVSYGYPGGLSLHLINTCRTDSDCPQEARCVEGECQRQ